MAKYFLDTHVFCWFLNDDEKLDKNIREDIVYTYSKDQYIVSDFVMLELAQLKRLNKVVLKNGIQGVIDLMIYHNIKCEQTLDNNVWLKLDEIPMQKINNAIHADPFDRVIIANCIQYNYTMISADTKFPHYRQFGLNLIEA